MENIEELYIQDNKITSIQALSSLINLRILYATDNKISDISPLKDLKNLNAIRLKNNLISDIRPIKEVIFQNIQNIDTDKIDSYKSNTLSITNNPLTFPPLEVVNQGYLSVLNWFNANKKELKEVKVILIGEPKAGKTSILKWLYLNQIGFRNFVKFEVFENYQ